MNYLCLIVAFLGVVTADEVVSTNDAVRVGTLQFQQMIQNTNWCSCPREPSCMHALQSQALII